MVCICVDRVASVVSILGGRTREEVSDKSHRRYRAWSNMKHLHHGLGDANDSRAHPKGTTDIWSEWFVGRNHKQVYSVQAVGW